MHRLENYSTHKLQDILSISLIIIIHKCNLASLEQRKKKGGGGVWNEMQSCLTYINSRRKE